MLGGIIFWAVFVGLIILANRRKHPKDPYPGFTEDQERIKRNGPFVRPYKKGE